MKHAYKVPAIALVLFLGLASEAAAAPGPLDSILSAPFEIGGRLVNFAVSLPASFVGQPHRARHGRGARVQHAQHRRRHEPAYRYKESAPL